MSENTCLNCEAETEDRFCSDRCQCRYLRSKRTEAGQRAKATARRNGETARDAARERRAGTGYLYFR